MDSERLQPPPLTLLDRYRGQGFLALYTTTVTVSGGEAAHGLASGVARSDDGNLILELRLPSAMGGPAAAPIRSSFSRQAMPPAFTGH